MTNHLIRRWEAERLKCRMFLLNNQKQTCPSKAHVFRVFQVCTEFDRCQNSKHHLLYGNIITSFAQYRGGVRTFAKYRHSMRVYSGSSSRKWHLSCPRVCTCAFAYKLRPSDASVSYTPPVAPISQHAPRVANACTKPSAGSTWPHDDATVAAAGARLPGCRRQANLDRGRAADWRRRAENETTTWGMIPFLCYIISNESFAQLYVYLYHHFKLISQKYIPILLGIASLAPGKLWGRLMNRCGNKQSLVQILFAELLIGAL